MITTIVLAVTALATILLLAVVARPDQTARRLRFEAGGCDRSFSLSVARTLAALSLVGVLTAGAVALMIDPCAQLR